MRIICPFTNLSQETAKSLEGWRAEFVDVSDGPDAYWKLLARLWVDLEDFMIVEQDIVIGAGTVSSFALCQNKWCCAPYPYLSSEFYTGLGCCRFRSVMMMEAPAIMEYVAHHDYPNHSKKHWCTLDAAMQRELAKFGFRPCLDHPPVGHLHDTPTHGCC